MEKIERVDFKCLRYYMRFNSEKNSIENKNIEKPQELTEEQKNRLIKLKFISFDLESTNFRYPNRFITHQGYKEFCRLRNININFWKLINIIIYVVLGTISIIALTRTL
ncbi:MAG: hypothetical protein KJ674_02780 [Nanoarchaeota archaeon]|nr:hypothetical protein [Nanoarchaeota archaeon]